MACVGAKSPANIDTRTPDKCEGKCSFSFSYDETKYNQVENKLEKYIAFSLVKDQTGTSVQFNSKDYEPTELRIYQPSLHTYNNKRADAEVVIVHTSLTGTPLYVCTPLGQGASRGNIDTLISQAAAKTPSAGLVKPVQGTVDLEALVHNSPFFTYIGTNLECQGDTRYIVYAPPNVSFYSKASHRLLKKILPAQRPVPTIPSTRPVINPVGPVGTAGGEGNLYIKCNPTGSKGETISVPFPGEGVYDLDKLKEYSWLFTSFLGAVVMLLLWYAFGKLMGGIFGPPNMRDPAPPPPPSS